MKNKRSFALSINAMFLALTIIFVFVPMPGLVTSSVLMLLPTIIMSQILGIKSALFQGFMLGVLLFMKGYVYITSPTDVTLQNPLISIFPRIIVALVVFGISTLGKKLFYKIEKRKQEKEEKNKINNKKIKIEMNYLFSLLSSWLGTLVNTIVVLLMFYLFYRKSKDFGAIATFDFMFYSIFVPISTMEMLITTLVAPPIVLASRKAINRIINKV